MNKTTEQSSGLKTIATILNKDTYVFFPVDFKLINNITRIKEMDNKTYICVCVYKTKFSFHFTEKSSIELLWAQQIIMFKHKLKVGRNRKLKRFEF